MSFELENQVREQFHHLWDHCPIGLLFVRVDGTIVKANRTMPYIVGYSESELSGRTWMSITHPEDLVPDLISIKSLLDGNEDSYRMIKRHITKFGTVVWVIITVVVIRKNDSNLGFLVFIEDVQKNMNITPEYVNDQIVFRPKMAVKDFFKDNWKTIIPWFIAALVTLGGFAYGAISDRIRVEMELHQIKEQLSRKP